MALTKVNIRIFTDVFISPSLNKTIGPNPAPELNPATVAPSDNPVWRKACAIAMDAAQFGINPNKATEIISNTGLTFNVSINSSECVNVNKEAIKIVIAKTQK